MKIAMIKIFEFIPEFAKLFANTIFQEAMDFLDEHKEWEKESFLRDLDLVRYFDTIYTISFEFVLEVSKSDFEKT